MGLRAVKLTGWLVIAAGMLVSVFRVVMALDAQAFDRVSSAGLPALICLGGGGLLLALAHAIGEVGGEVGDTRATVGRVLANLCPTRPTSLIGSLLLFGGLGWIVYVYMALDEPSVRAWAIVPASLGGLAALVGLILLMMGAGSSSAKR